MTTFGQKLWETLRAESARLGRKCTEAEFIAKADALAQSQGVMRKRKPAGAARGRNPLFDALALATGTNNLAELSRTAGKQIGIALADILSVCPDLTVEEIKRRAAAYQKRWPEERNWSAPALAKHWAQFGAGAKTKGGAADVYQEPKEWRGSAIALFGFDASSAMFEKGWFNIGVDYRAQILAHLKKAAS